jgi:hypothetical protein
MFDKAKTLSGVETHDNGDLAYPPMPGDALVFNATAAWPFGHVAIITNVSKSQVTFVQQNIEGKPIDTLPLDGNDFINSDKHYPPVRGWLHAKANTKAKAARDLTPSVSQMDWKNASYKITCDGIAPAGFKVRLQNGLATVSGQAAGSPDYDYFDVRYQASVTGDLDGDGSPETVVLLQCSPQPSNFTVQEVLVLHSDGTLLGKLPRGDALKAGAILPPQYVPNELSVRDGDLHAGMLAYGPRDSHASGPTRHQTFVWHWNGSIFQQQQQKRRTEQGNQVPPPPTPVPVPVPAPVPTANQQAPNHQHQDKPKPEVPPKLQPKLAPYASLSPESGSPGTIVNASGGGWAPNKPVTVTQSGPNVTGGGGAITADGNGDIDSNFRIAEGTEPGEITVTFRQGSAVVRASFTVE